MTYTIDPIPLWTPNPATVGQTRMAQLIAAKGKANYAELWQWSVDEPEAFWSELWDFCGAVGEKGTKIVGEYQGGLNRGQYRLFVLWTRAVTPRGIAIDVGSPATDALGRGGMDGRVDNFFWQRFGTALLFSLVEDAATVGSEAIGNSASNTTRVPSDAASTILQQNSQIKPVLRKNQGEDVGITVAQDFDFSTVYGLSLK